MENYKRRAVELISNLMLEYKGEPAVIPYSPQKTKISALEAPSLKRGNPQRYGISPSILRELLTKLEEEKRANIHSIMIIKDGTVISEASRPGYSQNYAHLSHSMSKSVIGIVIGMLYDDGKIDTDDLVIGFFNDGITEGTKLNTLTVHHLLSMKSGISFSEVGSVTESEWARAIFAAEPDFPPGERFAYNSMNSYLLACIAEKLVKEHYGISLIDYIDKRLFIPLGIRNRLWEIGPEGIEKGGWGLYMSVESWAKLGIMMLAGGVFEGKRILSREWINRSCTSQSVTPDSIGHYNYGYQIWTSRDGSSFLFNGMLGQNVLVDPRTRTVFAVTAGDTCLFQTAHSLLAAEWAIHGSKKEKPRLPSLRALWRLRRAERNFGKRESWLPLRREHDEAALEKSFEDYKLFSEHRVSANNAGLLPMLWRLVQNNHTGGLCDLTLKKCENGEVLLSFLERDESYTLRLGHRAFKESTVTVHGEPYRVACGYAFSRDEGRAPVFKAQITFPELSVTRRLIIKVLDGHLTLLLFEAPDFTLVEKLLTSAHLATGQSAGVVSFIREKVNFDGLLLRASTVFSPVLRLKSLSLPIDCTEADDPLHASAPIPNTTIPSLADPKPHKDATVEKLLAEEKKSEKKARTRKATRGAAKKP